MKNFFLKTLIASTFILIIFSVFTTGYILNLKSGVAENVLRLHIVGASNEAIDQDLKLKVRDRILKDYSNAFRGCKTIDETLACAEKNLSKIEDSAKDELTTYGCNSHITAELKKCNFPTKTYGYIRLPAGEYTALNIKIGDAKGKNWWCVMYPPLCITEGTISVPDSSKERLKEVLSNEEYGLITGEKEIRFKIAEIIGRYIK